MMACSAEIPAPPPRIDEVVPSTHIEGTEEDVAIIGANFVKSVGRDIDEPRQFEVNDTFVVTFRDVQGSRVYASPRVTYSNEKELIAAVPTEITTGSYDVSVETPLGENCWKRRGLTVISDGEEFPTDTATGDDDSDDTDTDTDTETLSSSPTMEVEETDSFSDEPDDSESVSGSTTDTSSAYAGSDTATDLATSFDTETDTGPATEPDTETATDTATQTGTSTATDVETDTFLDLNGVDVAHRASGPIEIDGYPDETDWELTTPVRKVVVGTLDDTVVFDVLWNMAFLYIALYVYDDVLVNDSPASENFNDDSVDFSIDGNHNGGQSMDAYDDHCILEYTNPSICCHSEDYEAHTGGIDFAWQSLDEGGYSLEMAVPWSFLGVTPSLGQKIGFDIGVNDDDGDQGDTLRDNQLRWNDITDIYWEPFRCGEITLTGMTPSRRSPSPKRNP